MQPVYPYIAVAKIEDKKSNLVQTIEETPVVKVVGLPDIPEGGDMLPMGLGQKLLVNHVSEYNVKGERLYFVRTTDIVSIV